jgi:hypothetical protein
VPDVDTLISKTGWVRACHIVVNSLFYGWLSQVETEVELGNSLEEDLRPLSVASCLWESSIKHRAEVFSQP